MIRVETGSRLHFGLLNPTGVPGLRRFGGVGLMIEEPALRLTVRRAKEWSATGPSAERALAFGRRLGLLHPMAIEVQAAPPEHAGFGSGTQLGLAVGRACSLEAGLGEPSVESLCRRTGRGLRSGLGAHGFAHGGFLIDGGKDGDDLAPLIGRWSFPEPWRIVVALADEKPGLHDGAERGAFERLGGGEPNCVDTLCRLVLLGMMPALAAGRLEEFGEALYEFNVRVGEAFAAAQGGVYGSPAVQQTVEFVRRQGVAGVGQSSWGPAVFAVVGDADRAADLNRRLQRRGPLRTWVTAPRNRGAMGESLPGA